MTNLIEVTTTLAELMFPFIKAQKEYSEFMYEWDSKKAWWYRQEDNIALKNAEMREAALQGFMEQEGLAQKKLEISNKFYKLKYEKEFLIELSKSLRIIEGVR